LPLLTASEFNATQRAAIQPAGAKRRPIVIRGRNQLEAARQGPLGALCSKLCALCTPSLAQFPLGQLSGRRQSSGPALSFGLLQMPSECSRQRAAFWRVDEARKTANLPKGPPTINTKVALNCLPAARRLSLAALAGCQVAATLPFEATPTTVSGAPMGRHLTVFVGALARWPA